jgi:hypothetical protein
VATSASTRAAWPLDLPGPKNYRGSMLHRTVRDRVEDLRRQFAGAQERWFPSWRGSAMCDPHYVGAGTHENLGGRNWTATWILITTSSAAWVVQQFQTAACFPWPARAVIFETTETSWHGFRRIRPPPGKPISRGAVWPYIIPKTGRHTRPRRRTGPFTTSALYPATSSPATYSVRKMPGRFRPCWPGGQDDSVSV